MVVDSAFFFQLALSSNDKKLLCNTDNSDGVLHVLYYTCSLRPVLSGNLKPKKGAFFNNRFLKLLRRETVINPFHPYKGMPTQSVLFIVVD